MALDHSWGPAGGEVVLGEHVEHVFVPPELLVRLLVVEALGPGEGQILMVAEVEVVFQQLVPHKRHNPFILTLVDRVIQELMLKRDELDLFNLLHPILLQNRRALDLRHYQQVGL